MVFTSEMVFISSPPVLGKGRQATGEDNSAYDKGVSFVCMLKSDIIVVASRKQQWPANQLSNCPFLIFNQVVAVVIL